MATIKENVKETLIGFKTEAPVESETRAAFMRHALTDENGNYYLDENKFVGVIAPETEDYVSCDRQVPSIARLLFTNTSALTC